MLSEPGEGQQLVHYQSASSDGGPSVLHRQRRLSVESGEEPVGEEPPEDLYEFELTSQPGQPLRGRLTDLTPDETAGSADVLNLIPGASEDGSSVYFVANGVLAPGREPGSDACATLKAKRRRRRRDVQPVCLPDRPARPQPARNEVHRGPLV